ncbi:type I MADS-domain transcription factor [Selaginella moellendorffii]|uniref:Type I MADS-domain transcription factor n=1 Tax=Selaginella moellendorffii TaxID=88036 RepID=D8SPX6_SELML|nr:type I MADS-domain transcription factor [Selaginella moellendorffii]
MGRRKLPIEFIRNDKSRRETFKKRLKGLRGKAEQLATLCNAEVGVIVICDGKVHEAGFTGNSGNLGGNAIDFKDIITKYAMHSYQTYQLMAIQRMLHPEMNSGVVAQAQGGGGLLDLNLPGGGILYGQGMVGGGNGGMEGGLPVYNNGNCNMTTNNNNSQIYTSTVNPPLLAAGQKDLIGPGDEDSISNSSKSSIATTAATKFVEPSKYEGGGGSAPPPHHHHHHQQLHQIDQLASHYTDFNMGCGFPGGPHGGNAGNPSFDNGYGGVSMMSASAANAAAANNGGYGGDLSSRGGGGVPGASAPMSNLMFDGPFQFNTLDDMDFDKHWTTDDPVSAAAAAAIAATTTAASSSTTTTVTAE